MVDADAANGMYFLINHLHEVIPCKECQNHAKLYLQSNRFDPRLRIGVDLRNYTMNWLMDFHNAVRARKSQPIIVSNVEAYFELWRTQKFETVDDKDIILYFNYGKMYHIINPTNLSRWNNQLRRIRLSLGV
jgi:hypothetical protein